MLATFSLHDLDALDATALKALILLHRDRHESLSATLSKRPTEIEQLKLLVDKLRRISSGRRARRSSARSSSWSCSSKRSGLTSPAKRAVAAKPFRRPLPEHLPREVHTHLPDHAACPNCGGRLRELGEDVAEMLEYVRACFKVIRHVCPKLSCDGCDRIVHARHKFHEIHIAHASPTTTELIERIAAIYAIEAEIRGSTPEIRMSIRQTRARPLFDSLRTLLELTLAKLNGRDLELYLHHVLERIADHPITRIRELLPWNVARSTYTCSTK